MSKEHEKVKTGLELLREPFPANQISKLPKPTKKQTEEVKADYKKGTRCQICGTWHHPDVVHLDYVGHAALTDRLLDADPMWSWEPLAVGPNGYPVIDGDGGMWIKLTVCGVTRLGYGDAQGKQGGDAMKERIGDALRNAAMRFGAALDLWHKGDLHGDDEGEPENRKEAAKSAPQSPPATPGNQSPSPAIEPSKAQIDLLNELAEFCHGDTEMMGAVLDEVSHYSKDGKEGYLKVADLEKGKDHAGFQKWVGSSLGKLRDKVKVAKAAPVEQDIPY